MTHPFKFTRQDLNYDYYFWLGIRRDYPKPSKLKFEPQETYSYCRDLRFVMEWAEK